MVRIFVDKSCCKGCNICINVCPKKVFVGSKQRSNYGTNMPEAKNTADCVNCHMCERQCPDGAIDVMAEKGIEDSVLKRGKERRK